MKKRLVKEKSSFHAAHKHNNDSVDFGDQHHDNYVLDNAVGHVDVDDDHRSAQHWNSSDVDYLDHSEVELAIVGKDNLDGAELMMMVMTIDYQLEEDFPHIWWWSIGAAVAGNGKWGRILFEKNVPFM